MNRAKATPRNRSRGDAKRLVWKIMQFAQERPYVTVGATMVAGYVLGGGLFTSTTARALKVGAQVASWPAVQDSITGAIEDAFFKETP